MKKIIIIFILAIFATSCNEYQKALKSEDMAVKLETATKLYEKEKYFKALTLFEQIAPAYKGKPQAEKLFYMQAQSYYKSRQYGLSGYHFGSFASGYPKSEKVEEAFFLAAKSYSMMSPVYSLDQVDTDKAIEKLQEFIDRYPNSQYFSEANSIVRDLKTKLEKKAFENARQFNYITDYKAAIVALDNFVADFPGTPFKEEALYYKLDSAYQLAINSVPEKMEARLNNAKASYVTLMKFKEDTKYKEKANTMLATIETELKKYNK
ncbi:outer membrane protein assembly factor BamD [Flavobacterium sp.]|uniref:outer membrane protein assembly factor BamD n=1 Tax=Flavobacterium sp. TaxID=239 RepID=UPI002621CBA2|nr:outer membrane protein assembly factor BamD [Flavobacterium sp.]